MIDFIVWKNCDIWSYASQTKGLVYYVKKFLDQVKVGLSPSKKICFAWLKAP